jgi:osmotically-inducible protein OsmY
MLKALLKLVLFVTLLFVVAGFFFGYRWGGAASRPRTAEPVVGTSGTSATDRTERARETGAKIGEKVAVGTERAREVLDESRLTAKVKSKIALDDTLKGTDITAHTSGTTVTLEGQVANAAQHQRVLQLTRETDGVSNVVDRITVR